MAKLKNFYVCNKCGHKESKWLGRCPDCGSWNSLEEQQHSGHGSAAPAKSITLAEIKKDNQPRLNCGIEEMNRVLGGGLMSGSAILLGGEPGIGKSTLIMQTAEKSNLKTVYISGEETAQQLKQRSLRLGITGTNIHLICQTNLTSIIKALEKLKPEMIILDSIQTIIDEETGSVPGTVNQLKLCTLTITRWAKEHNASLICIAHVTKEGTIAGPKVIEHMVDTVLYFDRSHDDTRFLRSIKNRYGPTDEVGLFSMSAKGLTEIKDPRFFIEERQQGLPPGIAFVPVYEGSRAFIIEIQTLIVPAKGSYSRVYSDRIEANKVSRIAAVLEKNFSMNFSDQDIYVNVAGGIKINETASDLALAAALYSGRIDKALPSSWAFCGEISLAGEIRHIAHMERRTKTAAELGFTHVIGPNSDDVKAEISYMKTHHIKDVFSLIAKALAD